MSVISMTNAAAARRPDTFPLAETPKTLNDISLASALPPTTTLPDAERPQPVASASVDTTFNVLFGYIPTEVLTLYVATLAFVHGEEETKDAGRLIFWIFLFLTPAIVWLVFGAKVKALGKQLPLRLGTWPVWEMFAATAAYTAWAFAMPDSPFTGWSSPALGGFAVLVVSTMLGLLAPIFQRSLAV